MSYMGEYYLHTNGELIYKPHGGVQRDSPFVVKCWEMTKELVGTPQDFCNWLRECRLLGADHDGIRRLMNKNELHNYIPNCEQLIFMEQEERIGKDV